MCCGHGHIVAPGLAAASGILLQVVFRFLTHGIVRHKASGAALARGAVAAAAAAAGAAAADVAAAAAGADAAAAADAVAVEAAACDDMLLSRNLHETE